VRGVMEGVERRVSTPRVHLSSSPLLRTERGFEDAGGRLDGHHGCLIIGLVLDELQGRVLAHRQAGAAGEAVQAVADL